MTQKHTPTPYKTRKGIITDLTGKVIAYCGRSNIFAFFVDKENAKFIVRACNSHEYAESVAKWVSQCFDDASVNFIPAHIAADAREFLEKAKAVQS